MATAKSHHVDPDIEAQQCHLCYEVGRIRAASHQVTDAEPLAGATPLTAFICCGHFRKLMGAGAPCTRDDTRGTRDDRRVVREDIRV